MTPAGLSYQRAELIRKTNRFLLVPSSPSWTIPLLRSGSSIRILLRHILIGIAVGLRATTLVYSLWGKQSGAHR
jgi:hypothetical protein